MKILLEIDWAEDVEHYLSSSAKIRGISVTRLIERMLKTICADQMILAILDDDSKQPKWLPGETTHSHFKPRKAFP